LVLTVVQMLRKKGVVEKFVEFLRLGPVELEPCRPRHHRQHGAGVRATVGYFPIDDETLRYMTLTGAIRI